MLKIEKHEWSTFTLASLFAFGSVALAIFIRTWSDTLFLIHFQADKIPIFYIWSAIVFAPTTMGYTWLSQRFNLIRLNTSTLIFFASMCLACINPTKNKDILFVLLLGMSLVSPLVNAICWGLILEKLNSRQSKRLLPLISSSATIGATISGTLGAEIIEWGGTPALMTLICSTLLLLTPFPSLLIQKETPVHDSSNKDVESQTQKLFDGLYALSRNRLLRISAIATFMMAIATNIVDYLFKVKLQTTLTPQELGPFFARFHAVSNLAILFIQLTVLTPVLQRFGVKHSFRLYPGLLVILGSTCLLYAHLLFFTLLRGVDTVMKFTFHQNTENIVMTPVPFLERTQSKVFLKGIIYPLGGLVAGLLIFLIDFTAYATFGALMIMLGICLVWLWILHKIHHHYIQQLALNLDLAFITVPTVKTLNKKACRQEAQRLKEKYLQQDTLTFDEIHQALYSILKLIGYDTYTDSFIERITHHDKQSTADLVELLDQLLRLEGIYKMENVLDHIFRQHHLAK